MVVSGIDQASQTISGFSYARGAHDRAFRTLALSVAYSVFALFAGTTLIQLFPGFFIGMLCEDIQVHVVVEEIVSNSNFRIIKGAVHNEE